MIGFDLIQYIKDTQKTTVRKNVSIPSWLNELGKNYNLNFSNLLQEAIKKELDID
ncbi:HicB family toxin-antitoxin system [Fusobacterium animalis ATCC 51191]|uniref:HicB family toxin-antitoxin system n=1 Tax=Fusobacterium animalis ATCC 51191 TaxID=997347 RepID=F9ENT0_9FUSO|nr:HicB family toxin-antitoxin system [Fusobacterium animalis ATCC 51191]